jgi:hypothetical protein
MMIWTTSSSPREAASEAATRPRRTAARRTVLKIDTTPVVSADEGHAISTSFDPQLDAMSYGVSDHVRQGVPKRRQHLCVQATGAANRLEQNFLMKRLGGIANSALERRENSRCGKETQAVGCITHLCKLGFDLVDSRRKVALEALEVIAKFLRHCAGLRSGNVPSCPVGFGPLLQRNIFEQVASQ